MPMIRRRGKRYQWRVTLRGFAPIYGTCPTRECAAACARAGEQRLRRTGGARSLTLAEAIDAFAADFLPRIPDSAPNYRAHLAFWRDELGALELDAITPRDVATSRARLQRRPGARGRRLAPATVNHYHDALAAVFRWCLDPERALATSNPARLVKPLKEPKERVRFLSRPVDEERSELERLLEACRLSSSPILADVVTLLLWTGCRASEILELERAEIRLEESGFTIPAERAKTETPRFVPLEGDALAIVRRRLALPTFGSRHLFPGKRRGRPATFPRTAWRTALRLAGISNFRPHDLRHTFLSYLAMLGKTLPEIMAAGGHADAKSALRYIHLADERKRAIARDAADALSGYVQRRGPA